MLMLLSIGCYSQLYNNYSLVYLLILLASMSNNYYNKLFMFLILVQRAIIALLQGYSILVTLVLALGLRSLPPTPYPLIRIPLGLQQGRFRHAIYLVITIYRISIPISAVPIQVGYLQVGVPVLQEAAACLQLLVVYLLSCPTLYALVGQKLGIILLLLVAPTFIKALIVLLLGSIVGLLSSTILLLVVVSLVSQIELVLQLLYLN